MMTHVSARCGYLDGGRQTPLPPKKARAGILHTSYVPQITFTLCNGVVPYLWAADHTLPYERLSPFLCSAFGLKPVLMQEYPAPIPQTFWYEALPVRDEPDELTVNKRASRWK